MDTVKTLAYLALLISVVTMFLWLFTNVSQEKRLYKMVTRENHESLESRVGHLKERLNQMECNHDGEMEFIYRDWRESHDRKICKLCGKDWWYSSRKGFLEEHANYLKKKGEELEGLAEHADRGIIIQ